MMPIENVPELYIQQPSVQPGLFAYDLRMTEALVKTKVNLSMHMFSFLQTGKKQVHFADASVLVDNKHSILIKKGNCLWSELLDKENIYCCRLLFFSEDRLRSFLDKHPLGKSRRQDLAPYFEIENDVYLTSYITSLDTLMAAPSTLKEGLLAVKFEELLLYLISKYGATFESYLSSLVAKGESSFSQMVEKSIHSSLQLEELAFLCNMSLSTFRRHFLKEYGESPGRWFRDKRLLKAKKLLEESNLRSTDIYLDLGYNNLSNFSSAFKARFGVSPSEVK